jgi:hypothetical protein
MTIYGQFAVAAGLTGAPFRGYPCPMKVFLSAALLLSSMTLAPPGPPVRDGVWRDPVDISPSSARRVLSTDHQFG